METNKNNNVAQKSLEYAVRIEYDSIISDNQELFAILTAILRSAKAKPRTR